MVIVSNEIMLGRAALGAALSPAGRKNQGRFQEYRLAINSEAATFYNPQGIELQEGFTQRLRDLPGGISKGEYLTPPWSSRRLHPSRTAASTIAYVDDHGKNFAGEYFPAAEMTEYLRRIKETSQQIGRPLTVLDQFDLALAQAGSNPVAAALLAHASYRAVARSCDTRIHPSLTFPVDSNADITMMNIARATADFKTSFPERDSLGDTYHFWAQVVASMTLTMQKKDAPLRTRLYKKALYHSAFLSRAFRQDPALFGHHKEVDRQGHILGEIMGQLLLDKTRS